MAWSDPDRLADRIEAAYANGGHALGWRFLYSPHRVLDGAEIALIELHPRGYECPPVHADFAMETASAYETESWSEEPPGESVVQRQVRALFGHLGVRPEAVLAGNLVPFRAPNWASMPNRELALEFGRGLWRDVLDRAAPRLVIGTGRVVTDELSVILDAGAPDSASVDMGDATATRAPFADGTLIGLPDLGEHPVVTHPPSQPALRWLFGSDWQG